MKANLLYILVLGFCFQAAAQWSDQSFMFGGLEREYKLYVPLSYDSNRPASLIVTLHGMGDDRNNFSQVGFDRAAETSNYIVVVPQAISDKYAGTTWNAQAGLLGYYPNKDVDDIGFINAIIDTVESQYAINSGNVFLCGFSMGGFMAQRMACEANSKFSAIASVAGTLGNNLSSCHPGRSIPIAHFHGTKDFTVGYYANGFGLKVDSLIHLWMVNNNCDTVAVKNILPHGSEDTIIVEHYLYQGDDNVELYKVNGGGHVWFEKPPYSISYVNEIMKFFGKYEKVSGIAKYEKIQTLKIYPNPTDNFIAIDVPQLMHNAQLKLYDLSGRLIYENQVSEKQVNLSLKEFNLNSGTYVISLADNNNYVTQKVILN